MVKEITAKHVLFGLIGFFAIIFAVNGVFLTHAIQSFPGEAEEKSYLQGINFNEKLSQKKAQASLEWRSEIGLIEAGSPGNSIIEARFFDAQNMPINMLNVSATLSQHDDDHQQMHLSFKGIGDGRYQADVSALTAGRVTIEIMAVQENATSFNATKTIQIR